MAAAFEKVIVEYPFRQALLKPLLKPLYGNLKELIPVTVP